MTTALAYVPAVLEAHLDQGAFLWLQWYRDRYGETPAADLGQSLQQRLQPHLEGWLLQPEAAWALYEERCQLQLADAGEHFLGTCLALQTAKVDWVRAVTDRARDAESLMALRDAMRMLPPARIQPWAERFAKAADIRLRLLGQVWFDASVPNGIDIAQPGVNADLQEFACLAVTPAQAIHDAIVSLLRDLPPPQRYRLGRHLLTGPHAMTATEALLPLTLEVSDYRDELIRRCFRNLESAAAKPWIQQLKTTPEPARCTLLAIGALREKALLPWVLQQLNELPLARVAGWALEQLLDLDLAERGWIVDEPDTDAPFMDDPRDLERPWPDVQAITDYAYQDRVAYRQKQSGAGAP